MKEQKINESLRDCESGFMTVKNIDFLIDQVHKARAAE